MAVCVRDHWSELSEEQRTWCREFLLKKILEDSESSDEMLHAQRFPMASSRAAARILPLLLKDADESGRHRICEAIAVALTHPIDEVRQYAAVGIGQFLWDIDPDLASACVAGLIEYARMRRRSYGAWRKRDWEQRAKLTRFFATDAFGRPSTSRIG